MAVAVETRRLLIAIALLLFIFGVATGAASREQIAASKAAAIERFNAWCESNGVLSSKLTTVWSPAFGFHVKMNDRCEKGEIAMLVPDKMVFGPHLVSLAPPEMQPFIANMTEFDRRAVLLILERRNTSSFWKPYLDMLPALGDFDMPMLWTPELINELPSHHNEIAERAKKTMFRHEDASGRRGGYAHMKQFVLDEYPLLFPADVFTPESYIWAHMIFHTRAFAGRHGESVLVPVLDLLNHHPNSRQTHVMQGRNDDNIVQCDRVYLPGEESFNFYGFKGDSKLLHNYGYVHAPHVANPFNNVPFKLQLGVEPGIISGLKRNLLLDMSLNPDLLIFNLRKGALPPTLMTYMLISVCTDTDGEKVLRAAAQGVLVDLDLEIARSMLKRALKQLRFLLAKALQSLHPTTLERDRQLLGEWMQGKKQADDTTKRRTLLAIQTRITEKEIFKTMIEACKTASNLVERPECPKKEVLLRLARGDLGVVNFDLENHA